MGAPLNEIIKSEGATHVQVTGQDMVNLYRIVEGQHQVLSLARVGAGLRNHRIPEVARAFVEKGEWFRIGTEQWEEVDEIPTEHPLWPAQWAWPDCKRNGCGFKGCGYLEAGPPVHCRKYQPVVGTRQDVVEQLNAYLAQNGHQGRLAA